MTTNPDARAVATQVPYDDIRRALEKARDRFREYAEYYSGRSASIQNRIACEDEARSSQKMADALDGALNNAEALLVDAERWRMIAEPSEEVVEKVAHEISKVDHSGRCHLIQGTATEWSNPYCDCDIKQRRARAVLRALKGLVK